MHSSYVLAVALQKNGSSWQRDWQVDRDGRTWERIEREDIELKRSIVALTRSSIVFFYIVSHCRGVMTLAS